MSVSVCVFACPRSYLRKYTSDLHHIFVHVSLPMTVAWSSSGGLVIGYILSILWMTP